jgi:hypothetical protein
MLQIIEEFITLHKRMLFPVNSLLNCSTRHEGHQQSIDGYIGTISIYYHVEWHAENQLNVRARQVRIETFSDDILLYG